MEQNRADKIETKTKKGNNLLKNVFSGCRFCRNDVVGILKNGFKLTVYDLWREQDD